MQAERGEFYFSNPEGEGPEYPPSGTEFQAACPNARTPVCSCREMPINGPVHADDSDDPGITRVHDLANMGWPCNCSTGPIMPRFIFSRIKAGTLPLTPPPRIGLFARLMSHT